MYMNQHQAFQLISAMISVHIKTPKWLKALVLGGHAVWTEGQTCENRCVYEWT